MKICKRYSLKLSMLISCALLLQSCVVYQKTPVSLVEAAKQGRKTKITTRNQETFKYAYILRKDGVFYGVKMKGGKAIKTPLTEDEILEIRIRDQDASNWANISVATLGALLVGGALFGADMTVFGREVK